MPFSLTVSPPFSFMLTIPLSSHFIFWPFPTVTSIFHYSMLVQLFFLCVVCDDAPLSTNHYSSYSSLLLSDISPHNLKPIKRFNTSSSFSFSFGQQSTALWPFLPQLCYYPLKRGFTLFLFFSLFFSAIRCSVKIFDTFIAHALEKIALVLLYLSSV